MALPDVKVSEIHANLRLTASASGDACHKAELVDMDSKNGTYIGRLEKV